MARRRDGQSGWSRIDARRANAVVAATVVILVAGLAVVAQQLHRSQATSRDRVVARFHDRAQVVSALTQAIISSASAPPEQARRLGAAQVSTRLLDDVVRQGNLRYAVLLDRRGAVVAASRSSPGDLQQQLVASPAIRAVQAGAPVMLSDVMRSDTTGAVVNLALGLDTSAGRRILVSGTPAALVGAFLTRYLQRVPTPGGTAVVLDRQGHVVGARDPRQAAGDLVGEPGLLRAVRSDATGSYGGDRSFTAADVPGSTWRIVLTSSKSSLFASVSGTRKWLPWVLLVAFGIAALAFLVVLRRLLSSGAALSEANAELAAGNARLANTNALLRHAAELSRSNAELEQFASIASHDLQEPLRKVQTFAAQLSAHESQNLTETGRDYLRRMSNAAGRMRTLIDDLLMFSRVSSKGRPFVAVDLNDTLAQVLVDLELRIEESGAVVRSETLPTIDADPVQMRQLLLNLLGNAMKFRRPDAAPEITIFVTVRDGIAEITVGDNGLGFEGEYAERIFRAFERLHGASAYPGTGIGLALCRKIVDRHHGTITANATPGRGATFTINLPVEQPAEPEPQATSPGEPADVRHALA